MARTGPSIGEHQRQGQFIKAVPETHHVKRLSNAPGRIEVLNSLRSELRGNTSP